jgi:hypothetical protein
MKALWRCPKCKRTFANLNQSHSCGTITTLASHFRDREHARELFDAVAAAVKQCGPSKILPEKTRIAFHRRMSFLSVVVRKDRLLLGFVFARRIEDPRFDVIQTFSPRNHWHRLPIAEVSEIDAKVRAWIAEAYEVGEQRHLRKAEAPSA